MPSMKHLAVVAAGVLVGSMAVGPVLGMLNIERAEGFGMDDVLAALTVALAVIMVDRIV